METPSISDNDGEFCWEMDVELGFRLEERHVFTVCMEIAAGSSCKEFTTFLIPTFYRQIREFKACRLPRTKKPSQLVFSFSEFDIWMI